MKTYRSGTLRRQSADPDPFGGGMAEVNARRTMAGNIESHGFVVLALMDAQARAGAKRETGDELEKLGIFFVDT